MEQLLEMQVNLKDKEEIFGNEYGQCKRDRGQ